LDAIKTEITQYCTQLGLNLKQFDVKNEIRTSTYRKIPVLVRTIGNKDAALNLLNKLIDKNMNVNLSKIVFIASERNDQKINLILNMEIFYQI